MKCTGSHPPHAQQYRCLEQSITCIVFNALVTRSYVEFTSGRGRGGYRCTERLKQEQDRSASATSAHLNAQAALEQAEGACEHTGRLLKALQNASCAAAVAHGERARSQQCERQAAAADSAAAQATEEHRALLELVEVRGTSISLLPFGAALWGHLVLVIVLLHSAHLMAA